MADKGVWKDVLEDPLVTTLVGANVDDLPDLAVHVGLTGRSAAGDDPSKKLPGGGRMRLYVSFAFDEYLEFAVADVRAVCDIPGDLRVAVWLAGDAKVKRVGPPREAVPVEVTLLSGPVTQGGYGGPTAIPAPAAGWFPGQTLADAILRGSWEPSRCRTQCPSG